MCSVWVTSDYSPVLLAMLGCVGGGWESRGLTNSSTFLQTALGQLLPQSPCLAPCLDPATEGQSLVASVDYLLGYQQNSAGIMSRSECVHRLARSAQFVLSQLAGVTAIIPAFYSSRVCRGTDTHLRFNTHACALHTQTRKTHRPIYWTLTRTLASSPGRKV